MMIRNTTGSMKASAKAIGGKGLLIALVLAGIGIQGCSTEDAPATPAGTETPELREYESGEDIPSEALPEGSDGSEVTKSPTPLAKTAPTCVELSQRTSGIYRYAKVTNKCSTTQRVRLIWRSAFDGACTTLPSGYYYEERRGKQAYVTEVRGC